MQNWTEQEIEEKIGRLLRSGVSAAAIVMIVGAVEYLLRFGRTTMDYRTFHPDSAWQPGSRVILLAVALTVATPVARVAFAAYSFYRQGDRRYMGVSLAVFVLLAYALFRAF